jgi:hypothetical protein
MKATQTSQKGAEVEKLNDKGFRLLLIPAFGIGVPLLTGMVLPGAPLWRVVLSFLYNIFIAFAVWQGNRFLLFFLRRYFRRPVLRIVALVLAISLYTLPLSVGLIAAWFRIFRASPPDWNILSQAVLIIMICVLFITHVYETVFINRARIEAELAALKSQIDPHFLFNSLNTLSSLIEEKPARAKEFNVHLAEVYRYILNNRGRDLVLLSEEIAFLQDYFYLLHIRFEGALFLDLQLPAGALEEYLIPPISLQTLVENAVKHNEFSDALPLHIHIALAADTLIIHNQVRKLILRKATSQVGLRNLQDRYRYTTHRELLIRAEASDFTVHLPMLKIV